MRLLIGLVGLAIGTFLLSMGLLVCRARRPISSRRT
jgi:hypothetical protein